MGVETSRLALYTCSELSEAYSSSKLDSAVSHLQSPLREIRLLQFDLNSRCITVIVYSIRMCWLQILNSLRTQIVHAFQCCSNSALKGSGLHECFERDFPLVALVVFLSHKMRHFLPIFLFMDLTTGCGVARICRYGNEHLWR
jgi:hypothetical protein